MIPLITVRLRHEILPGLDCSALNLRGALTSSNFEQSIIGFQPFRGSIKIAPLNRARRALSRCVKIVSISIGIGQVAQRF